MINLTELKDQINALSHSDRRELIALLSSGNTQNFSLEAFQEARFSNGYFCPKCGCTEQIVRYGKFNDKQRYLCKSCKSTFTMTSKSLFHASKKDVTVWEKYLNCFINGFSLKKCAKICGISIPTAFFWRHKILNALSKKIIKGNKKLAGIIESDETYFLLFYKGQRKNLPRPSKRRGTPAKKRGLSKEQVCVPCGIDRTGHIISGISNLGKVSSRDLHYFYSGRVASDAIFCTDSEKSYIQFTKDNGYKLVQVELGKHKNGIFHINHVNSYHSALKNFLRGFKGVSTKYLENYLVWNDTLHLFPTDINVYSICKIIL